MIRKIICVIVLMIGFSFVGSAKGAKADIGEMPMPGGVITPGDKIDGIQMKSEDVVFSVKDSGAMIFTNQPDVSYYAHVKASFVMHNLGVQTESKQIFFPFHAGLQSGSVQQDSQAKNVKVTVDDRVVEVKYKKDVFNSKNASVESGVFDASFVGNGDTKIVVEYDLRAVNDAKSPNLAFSYMMVTGSHWADKIGNGKVTFDFTQDISSLAPFASANDSFELKDGNLVWEFNNLEPTEAQDIKLSFDPRALEVWGARPLFISNMTASQLQASFYQSENIRAAGDYPGGIARSNMVNILDYSSTNAGWLVEQKAATDEWLNFDFDDQYSFDAVQILSGYKMEGFDEATGRSKSYYDTYRRPKLVEVKFDNNLVESTQLTDDPASYQTIKLPSGSTKSLRLNFKDSYPGTGGGDKAFAVGRVKFIGAKKVGKAAASSSSTNSKVAAAGFFDIYQKYIIIGVCIVLVLVVIKLVLYFSGRHKSRLLQNPALVSKKNNKSGENKDAKKA